MLAKLKRVIPCNRFSNRLFSSLPQPAQTKYATHNGRLAIIGFGSIGQGILPLILRHVNMDPKNITLFCHSDTEAAARSACERYGIGGCEIGKLTEQNYEHILRNDLKLAEGDICVNLSVGVSSCAMMEYCNANSILYTDTVVEPWEGFYTDGNSTPAERSNYALREKALALKRKFGPNAPSALITHGANPGLVSHFVKKGLLNIAHDTEVDHDKPTTRDGWAALSKKLGVKAIHIAERDTQIPSSPKMPGEFVNTWSVEGFIDEGVQPAELGWGTHEKELPFDGNTFDYGTKASIWLNRPGCNTRVRTWTPQEGFFHGFLVTHGESISIADYLSVRDEQGNVVYRPTCHYAYHPCDDAVLSLHELCGKNFTPQSKWRLVVDEVVSGIDELGVLLMGHEKGAYWYGSQLEINQSRVFCPDNSATSLQVAATTCAGVIWCLENPRVGIVEPDEIDHERILEIAGPYVEPIVGSYTDWTPLKDRGILFTEDLDKEDPWQFKNIRVL